MAGSLARLSKYCPTPYLLQRCLTASNKTCTDDSPGLLDREYIISYNDMYLDSLMKVIQPANFSSMPTKMYK